MKSELVGVIVLATFAGIAGGWIVMDGSARHRASHQTPGWTENDRSTYVKLQQRILNECFAKGGVPIVSNGARVGESWFVSVDECQFPCGEKK